MPIYDTPVWFITGCSTGFGRELAKAVLQRGWRVVAAVPNDGPLVEDWHATDNVDVASLVWAECGALRNFNITTELRVSAGTSDTKKTTSFITMDSTDGALSTVYHFAWKECP